MHVRAVLAGLATLLLAGCTSLATEEHPRRVPPDYTGTYTTWWSDDRMREEGEYKGGRRHGYVKGYHPDGSLAFEGQFRDGLPVGNLVQHEPGGARAIAPAVQPAAPAVQPAAPPSVRAEPATPVRSEQAPGPELRAPTAASSAPRPAGAQRHGVVETKHPNGQLATRGRYEHDVPVGEWEAWDDQGRLVSHTVYWTTDGKAAGYLETAQDAEGHVTVQTRILLQGDDMLGRVTLWYANGLQAGLVEYRNGLRDGREISWDERGRKRSEGRRVADLREGVWTTWTETGAIESRTLFERDRAIGPAPPDA